MRLPKTWEWGVLTVAAAGDCAVAFRVRDFAPFPAHDCAAHAPPTPGAVGAAAVAADGAAVPVSVAMALSHRRQCQASPRWQCVVCE